MRYKETFAWLVVLLIVMEPSALAQQGQSALAPAKSLCTVTVQQPQEEITQTLIKEFNYGAGFEAGQIAPMMLELK